MNDIIPALLDARDRRLNEIEQINDLIIRAQSIFGGGGQPANSSVKPKRKYQRRQATAPRHPVGERINHAQRRGRPPEVQTSVTGARTAESASAGSRRNSPERQRILSAIAALPQPFDSKALAEAATLDWKKASNVLTVLYGAHKLERVGVGQYQRTKLFAPAVDLPQKPKRTPKPPSGPGVSEKEQAYQKMRSEISVPRDPDAGQ
jgi:hypothetical protein